MNAFCYRGRCAIADQLAAHRQGWSFASAGQGDQDLLNMELTHPDQVSGASNAIKEIQASDD